MNVENRFIGEPGLQYPGLVVSGVIIENGELLMAQRGPNSTLGALKWECPGGKVELGEAMTSAIIRELWEELDIIVVPHEEPFKVAQLLRYKKYGHERDAHWINPVFECKIVEGQPTIMEPDKCARLGWFPLDRLKDEDLTASAQQTIKALRQKYPISLPKVA